ncbi:MAG: tetratricopeptide repeat-containing glycosyltransferase family protein [Pseudomonadota bacterium]
MSETQTAPAKPAAPLTLKQAFEQAVALHRDGELDKAAVLYRLCLQNNPMSSTAWTNYGALLRRQSRYAEACAAHRKALEIKPDLVNARSNLANALCDLGEAAEAIEIRRKLIEEHPDEILRVRDLAIALRGNWGNQEAVDIIDALEAEGRMDENCQLQRSLAHLMLGHYKEGFRDFEARYSGDEVSLPEDAPWDRWMGESIDGKSIVILPEQGFGDAILMSRFIPKLKAMGAKKISMVVKKPLQRLFGRIEGLDEMLAGASKSADFDFYTPNMSLPHLVGMDEDRTPPPLPRLHIPDDSRQRAQKLVKPFGERFKIGIVWTGSLTYRANHRRSTTPDNFIGLAQVPGVQLFSLYKGDAHEDFVNSGMAGLIVDACGSDRDFADTAAIIDELDMLITTDTAVVHVGASMGKPIWNMLTYEGFWLYGSGDTTPWYPSMRLFRQRASGDWPELFDRVEVALREHLEARK